MTDVSRFSNHFLIAMPSLLDPNFFRAVAYVCEHNEDGAIGIIINQPTENQIKDILDQVNIECSHDDFKEQPVLFGGPLQTERGFIIHRPEGQWRSTLESSSHVHITTSKDILEALAEGKGPTEAIVALGCAGWGAGQLDEEILNNAWLVCPADDTILFKTPFNERWRAAAKLIGVDVDKLSDTSGHA